MTDTETKLSAVHVSARAIDMIRRRAMVENNAIPSRRAACDGRQIDGGPHFDANDAIAFQCGDFVEDLPTCQACRVLVDGALERPVEVPR